MSKTSQPIKDDLPGLTSSYAALVCTDNTCPGVHCTSTVIGRQHTAQSSVVS